ncbi:ESX-1 secretion system protein EccA1 (ESX conserved component A1) (Type VII secretion system protein EccA1) (T7SS protein EccA1) [Durusdinium trenchii]|uniref:ESX-1 secretion system protein EccA1 (ESX conserved component A1) (Type VII secretion system protein EccA1) (T7SS protein EccA1) n=1 Tax=Durusdinium trenchii TaxID=1381693 RepID=A0ABP0KNN0_9DINO
MEAFPSLETLGVRNGQVRAWQRVQFVMSHELVVKLSAQVIKGKKLALTKARELREYNEVQRVRESPETDRLAALLLWQREEQEFYCRLKADLDRAVGLQPVKEFIVQRLRDAAGRHVLKEGKQPRRHVLISGAFGVGKHVAAELIGRLFGLLNNQLVASVRVGSKVRLAAWQDAENRGALLSKNDVGLVTEELPPGSPKPLKVKGPSGRVGNYKPEELVAEPDLLISIQALTELLDPKTQKLRVADRSCFYMRLGGSLSEQDAEILEQVLEVGSVVIMAGPPEVVEANMQLSAFRRRQPDLLTLPTLSVNDVANLIAAEVEKRGYEGVGEGDVGTRQLITVLEHIVAQRFDEKLIREKNGHLARDVLDLAISRKNDRTWADSLDSAERFRLTPMDFGLDVLTAEQRERRMREVEAEVEQLVGWGSEEEAGSARHFFFQLRRQLGQAPRGSGWSAASCGGAGAMQGALHMPRALWVAANAGAGRETFVRLATCFLRAAGAISREEVSWVDGQEIADKGDPTELIAARLVAAEHGCLAIKDVDALVDSREAVRALAAALGNVDGASSGTTLFVILGTQQGLARIARMEPALEARFPTTVQIPDFLATELVQFMEISASKLPSGALAFEDQLAPRLAEHLNEVYGGGGQGKDPEDLGMIQMGELGERGNLALARRLLQRAVQNRITRLFNSIQEGESPSDTPESEHLTKEDFEVGAPIGEGREQKDAIDEEVGNLIGMAKAKEWFAQVRQKVAFVEQTGTRSDLRVCLNIIITGNPGTGKTTFARLLARFFHTYGVLPKDSFVEKNGLELKAEFMGGTAPRVKAAVQEAMGGCLFLDEAYALMDSAAGVGGGGDAFSQEALRTLLTEVENHRTNLMVVLAGYKEKMGRLMRAEEGLARRFPNRLHLDDYTPAELAQICEMCARHRHQREFEPGLREKLEKNIENFYWRDIAQQNAGLSVNLTEKALDRQIVRIVSKYPEAFAQMSRAAAPSDGPSLMRQRSGVSIQQVKAEVAVFTAADFGIEERPTMGDPELRRRVQEEVERLTGMANVKAFFKELSRTVAFVERGGDPRVLQTSLNLTGKTTVARLIGRYLYAHGVLPRDTFVERNALALKGQFVGQTAPTVAEAVRDAMGGCLFIDEAYALADRGGDKFSGEVIRTLLTEVENHRTGLLVVLAGYADKMDARSPDGCWEPSVLMDADPGLRRRFSLVLQLEDYSPEELAEICEHAAQDRFNLTFAPGLTEALAQHISMQHGQEIAQHNGGLAVTLAERAFRRLATRLGDPQSQQAVSGLQCRQLIAEDFLIGLPPEGVRNSKPEPSSPGSETGRARPPKRTRPPWQEAVGSLAREMAQELLRGMEGAMDDPLDEDMPGDSAPSRDDHVKAVAKALAKGKNRERPKEEVKEEEKLPQQEGEKVVEEMSTLDALDCLGLCPANFEWFELNVANPPDENCGICHYKLADGYRCGGGTHYVCMGCIDAYKTSYTR